MGLKDLCDWGTEVPWDLNRRVCLRCVTSVTHRPEEEHQGPLGECSPRLTRTGPTERVVRLSLDS